jgi:outer membrane protein assembly factor BamD (BamD/ComL family)
VAAFEVEPPSKASLGDELREVDQARRRLASGDAAGALADIARYEQRFPGGRLRQEAALLRVEALAASGRCAEARSAASGFLAAHPESVLAKRARTLLARCR